MSDKKYYHIKVHDDGDLDLWINYNPSDTADTWGDHVVEDSREACVQELLDYGYEDEQVEEFVVDAEAEEKLTQEV